MSNKLSVFAKLVGSKASHELAIINLTISETQANQLAEPNTGIYFDWGPDQQSYHSHIDKRPENEPNIERLIEIMANKKMQSTQKKLD